jgi:Flp pilus assembly protein TadD
MFLVKNSLRAILAMVLLVAPGCIQSSERTTNSIIAIDHSLTYGRGLQRKMVKARKAVRDNPDDPAPHVYLGNAYLFQNNLAAAEAEFRTVLSLSPKSAGAYYKLGRISTRRGKLDAALEHFQHAVELKPDYPEAHDALAHLYEKLGNFEKAAIHHNAHLEARKQHKADKEP